MTNNRACLLVERFSWSRVTLMHMWWMAGLQSSRAC